jgi:hypothetical protein
VAQLEASESGVGRLVPRRPAATTPGVAAPGPAGLPLTAAESAF